MSDTIVIMYETTRITLRLPTDLAAQITDRAASQQTSQNEWITKALAWALATATSQPVTLTDTRKITL